MGDPLAAFNIIAMTVGFLFVFFGYRFYKPTLFMGGFAFWAMFTFELCYYISNLAAYGSAAAAGVIGGTLSLWFYPLGVFTLGALCCRPFCRSALRGRATKKKAPDASISPCQSSYHAQAGSGPRELPERLRSHAGTDAILESQPRGHCAPCCPADAPR